MEIAARLEPPAVATGWTDADAQILERLRAARSPLVLAGPGVVLEGAIAGLHAFAVAGDVGVLNTWGAKGVFDWRSRHHLATVGLQARDAELAGVGECDLLVCTGVDDLEADPALWRTGPCVEVPPSMLAPLAEAWRRPASDLSMPPLRDRLAAATQAGWAATGSPLAPSQATRNYGEIVGTGGTVSADPGLPGFWVARTLGTTRPRAVHVPAEAEAAGFALACAAEAKRRWPDRPALAVIGELVAGTELPPGVAVEVWADDGDRLDAEEHAARLATLVRTGGVVRLATRPDQLAVMVEVAGDVTAWGGAQV